NVTHIVSTNDGCSDTITQTITVFNNPIAGFTHQNVCLGNAMSFTNTSIVGAPDVISNYLWAFGDGSPTSTQTNPSHTYLTEGNYTVTLIATTANSCSDVANITVSVYDPPTAGFSFNNVCENTPVSFTNTSNNPNIGNIGSFSWNFGDGSPQNSLDFNPVHTYTTAGTYTVTLIVNSSNLGCADTLQQTIDIYPAPTSNFSFQNECFGTAITFNNQSSGAVSYDWNFGNNNTSTLQNPQQNYSASGNYLVSLTVTSANGCTNTSSQTVTVYPMPVANFSVTEVCHGEPTTFTSTTSINSPDNIVSYAWNFGDGSSIATTNPAGHTYLQPGQYMTSLIVVSNNNCIDTITLPVTVNPNPLIDFNADNIAGCTPHCTNFNNLSSILTGNIAAYEWTLGNGSQSNVQNPMHCFINESLSPKYFNITLKATSDKGCVSTLTKNNYITSYPLPIADFSTDPNPTDIFRPTVQFNDLSIGASSWLWKFGDNTFNPDTIIQNPSHTYVDTGIFNVWLHIENVYGCKDSIAKPVNIRPDFALFIPNAFTPNGDSYNPTFAAKGYGIKEFTMYIFNRWGELIFVADDINKG
ncbi:MAG: PKD domain-containing protein, partial [Bacteroidia bacterium]